MKPPELDLAVDAPSPGMRAEQGADSDVSSPPRGPVGAPPPDRAVTDAEIQRLARLRADIRGYLAWAEEEARKLDTTPNQFQLALAIRASDAAGGPTVRDLAEALQLKHHSVVGLIDRAEAAGLVRRDRDVDHGARVRITLTPEGTELLERLAARHVGHLVAIASQMSDAWLAFES